MGYMTLVMGHTGEKWVQGKGREKVLNPCQRDIAAQICMQDFIPIYTAVGGADNESEGERDIKGTREREREKRGRDVFRVRGR